MVRPGVRDPLVGDAGIGERDRLLEHERLAVLAGERIEERRRLGDAIEFLAGHVNGAHGSVVYRAQLGSAEAS